MILRSITILLLYVLTNSTCEAQYDAVYSRMFGGSGSEVGNLTIVQDNGDILVCGRTNSTDRDIKENFGGYDLWAFKVDKEGKFVFSKTFGNAKDNICTSLNNKKEDGHIVSYGNEDNDNDTLDYSYIVNMNSEGELMWENEIEVNGEVITKIVKQLHDYSFLIVGTIIQRTGDEQIFSNKRDVFIRKLDVEGNLLFENIVGTDKADEPFYLDIQGDEISLIIRVYDGYGGTECQGQDDGNGLILYNLDDHGQVLNTSCYPEYVGYKPTVRYSDNNGELYITLEKNRHIIVCKLIDGHLKEAFSFDIEFNLGDHVQITGFEKDIFGNFYFISHSKNVPALRTQSILTKVSYDGIFQWTKNYGGSENDNLFDIAILNANSIMLTGFSNSNDGNIPFGEKIGGIDIWNLEVDSLGFVNGSDIYGGDGSEFGGVGYFDYEGNLIVIANTSSEIGPLIPEDIPANSNIWLLKIKNWIDLESDNQEMDNEGTDGDYEAYVHFAPNPTSDILQIDKDPLTTYYYSLFDTKGRMVLNKRMLQDEIDLSSLPSGLYILKIQTRSTVILTERIVKM